MKFVVGSLFDCNAMKVVVELILLLKGFTGILTEQKDDIKYINK